MSPHRPPRVARAVLAWLVPPSIRDETLADLDTLWAERVADGRLAARVWYWKQIWMAAGPSLRRRFGGGWNRARRAEREPVARVGRTSGTDVVGSIRQDLSFAIKQIRRQPGLAATVVLTLALGIGATTAIFSAVHSVLLRPLPYDDPQDLVMVTSRVGESPDVRFLSPPDALDLVAEVEAVEDIALFWETTIGPLTEADRPEHVKTTGSTWNAFDMLGVHAALGRTFTVDDAVPVDPNDSIPPPGAAVISHAFWERSFGADPNVLGRVVRVWGGAVEIVGVLPRDLRLLTPPELNLGGDVDIYQVVRWDLAQSSRESRWARTIARLDGGVSLEQAGREVDAFAARLRERYPHHAEEQTRLVVTSMQHAIARPVRGPLVLLMGAVLAVLLIACANVANLLLARGTARANEMAVRASLGAGRRRLVRQLLTESAVLALLGAAAGILLAAGGVRLLHAIRPADLHRLADVRLDGPVLAFTLVVSVLSTLLAGLLPAFQAARTSMADWLRVRGGSEASQRSRTVLVVAEVALSVVLLAGAGLLIRTFSELQRMPLGFEPEQVMTVTATQTGRPREERQAFESDVLRAVREVGGVVDAGIVFPLPMNGVYDRHAEYAMDGNQADPTAWNEIYFRTVSPAYFQTMGIELLRGRPFVPSDENYDAPVVILDQRLARREWGGRDPVGDWLWVRGMEGDTLQARVLGVVEYAPQSDHRDTRPTMYFPRVFYQSHEVSVVARVQGDAARMGPALSAAIRGVDPGFPSDLAPMSEFVSERLATSRFLVILMELFAIVALTLSAVGLFGVLSYTVRQQTRELGIRLAFGAQAGSLAGRVVLNGLKLALTGAALGLVGALLLGRGLESQLFRVSGRDPAALGLAILGVLTVAVLASLIPGLRASRLDPMVALRED